MKKVRLIDVAEQAGVSKSTVSQYLNGRFDYMSKDTKACIEAAVKALNYVPNPIARSLKTDKTKTIGVIVRDVTGFYTSRAIRGIDDYCKQHGYNVLIYNTDFDPEVEAKALVALNQLRVDGLILASTGKNTDLIVESIEKQTPVVEFQLEHDDADRNVILSNYEQAAYEATDYLIQLGHRRICFVTQAYQGVKSQYERYSGYAQALKDNHIMVDDALIWFWHRGTGFERSLAHFMTLDSPPTAFFAQHLAITTDLLNVLEKDNIMIPNDVSVIGFDDLPMADFFKVPITAVKQAPYKIGQEAAALLLENISNKNMAPKKVSIPCELVIRASCRSL